MIDVQKLTKRYGETVAVDGLSFRVEPGQVTGFLGPNGSGKTTTMRVILGLDAPSAGQALVNGRRYAELRRPLLQVGALLDATAVHPHRRALDHLAWMARSNRIPVGRAAACLEQVGLADAARTPVGEFSLGMKQRLGIAGALLGDPGVLLFDEPVNGLDPEGVRWIRGLLTYLASEGRTILLSSHLMSEMALTADALVIIGRGRLLATTTVRDLATRFGQDVVVRSPRAAELTGVLQAAGATVTPEGDASQGEASPRVGSRRDGSHPDRSGDGARSGQVVSVRGLDAATIGELAAARGLPLHELTPRATTLEDAYLSLTGGSVTYRSRPAAPAPPRAPASRASAASATSATTRTGPI